MSLLALRNIHLYMNGSAILKSVTATINAGELVVILGPNGAGKSSLLKVASGELTPNTGEIDIFSRSLLQVPLLQKAQKMAVLPQQSSLNFPFTVREVVALGRTPHSTGVNRDAQIVKDAIKLLDVERYIDHSYTQLSGGEKQRVQLARVLAQVWEEPSLLLLDEPTSALDFAHQQQIMTLLKQKTQQGSAVLMVLHDLNLAASFADKVIVLGDGEICAAGEPEQVLQETLLESVFDLKFHRVKHPVTGKTLFLN